MGDWVIWLAVVYQVKTWIDLLLTEAEKKFPRTWLFVIKIFIDKMNGKSKIVDKQHTCVEFLIKIIKDSSYLHTSPLEYLLFYNAECYRHRQAYTHNIKHYTLYSILYNVLHYEGKLVLL